MAILFGEGENINIVSIKNLLDANLVIPKYQRPYKWSQKNIKNLILDIEGAISKSKKDNTHFKYRLGTIILFKSNNNEEYEIIDGQQRIISLSLIKYELDRIKGNDSPNTILKNSDFNSSKSQENLNKNYKFIKDYFSLIKDNKLINDFINSFSDILEFVIIKVDKLSEAFQLFDSQNTRGKALYPHDLLKAYHLREIKNDQYTMYHAVEKWEKINNEDIELIFENYLFPILNWSNRFKTKIFSVNEIDFYKGIEEDSYYSYAKRARSASLNFQIGEPFISGNDFFEMVSYYITLLNDVKAEIENNEKFKDINKVLTNSLYNKSKGFQYAKNLFYAALLYYYDKFHNFDVIAIKKIFIYSMMLRIDMKNLGLDSINKYAIGEFNLKYTNNLPLFFLINKARLHNEISSLVIEVNPINNRNSKWDSLLKEIRSIYGEA